MKQLIIVRHGQAEHNVQGLTRGFTDSPLTELGQEQARLVGKRLASAGVERIYSSDMGRTVHTSTLINETLNVPVTLDARLRERNYGDFEGKPDTEFRTARGDTPGALYVPPNGESWPHIFERTLAILKDIQLLPPGETTVLVAHSGSVRALIANIMSIPIAEAFSITPLNCSVNCFEWNAQGVPAWIVQNSISHYESLLPKDG